MKSLQEFLIEEFEYNNISIQEGAIWDAIKEWFKNLFEPSDRPYDRYGDEEITGATEEDYIAYLKDNFNVSNCEVKKIDYKSLKKIISPKGVKPDLENKRGFYKFIDGSKDKGIDWISIIYKDEKTKDCPCLIKTKILDGTIEIIDLQIIYEYVNIFKLDQVIDLLKNNKETLGKDIEKIIFKESSDKDIYNQLINDCDFEEEYNKDENTNIANLSI